MSDMAIYREKTLEAAADCLAAHNLTGPMSIDDLMEKLTGKVTGQRKTRLPSGYGRYR
jgi:hypothetical protein